MKKDEEERARKARIDVEKAHISSMLIWGANELLRAVPDGQAQLILAYDAFIAALQQERAGLHDQYLEQRGSRPPPSLHPATNHSNLEIPPPPPLPALPAPSRKAAQSRLRVNTHPLAGKKSRSNGGKR